MPDRKRSLSPHTETSFNNQNSRESSNKLSNGSLKFKPSTAATANESYKSNQSTIYSPRGRKQDQIDNDIDLDGPILTNFESSDKRKRLSIQGHPPASGIPRSSVYNSESLPQNKLRSYSIICTDLKTSEEELNNDLEVRVTTKDNYNRSIGVSDVEDSSMSRDVSPFVNLPHAPNSDIITGAAKYNDEYDDDKISDGGSVVYNEGALVVQKEFGSLYQDEDGNLIRPPFINLDPRERYQLLQLKRSIELSESLQKRIKYMINPNETNGKRIPGTNKVEMSTQTHDLNYLSTKLNFKKRSPSLSFDRAEVSRPIKKPKRKGFAMKEFLYDVNEEKPVSSTSSLNGALGSITKPKFNSQPKTQDKSMTQIIPREDEEPSFKTFGNKTGRDRETFGVTNNAKLTLDPEYLEKTSSSSISDIIKLKEPTTLESSKPNKPTTGPSSGFKFDIKKNDFESIINDRKQNQEILAKSKLANETVPENVKSTDSNQSAKPGLFGSKPVPSQEAPKKKRNLSDSESDDKPPVPSFSFGSANTSKPATPSLFGNKEKSSTTTSLFNITNPKSNEEKDTATTKKPLFGKPSTESETKSDKPRFTFGAPASSNKPTFSFGKTPDSAEKEATPNSKPSLFGDAFKASDKTESSTTSKPSFSFGFNNATTTPFSLGGGEKKDTTPSSTPFTLGKTDTTKDDTKPTETTSLFGDKSKSGSTTPFTFGQKDDKAAGDSKEEDKSASTTKPPSTGFTFGAPAKTTESNDGSKGESNNDAASSTTATTTTTTLTPFKFGITNKASTDAEDKKTEEPATKKFNFATPSTDKPSTPFSFPSANDSSTSKPAFSLGGIGTTDNKEKKDTSSSPSITQSTTAPPLTSSTFSFNTKKPDAPATTATTDADAAKSSSNSGFKFAAGVNPPSQTTSNKPPSIFNFGAASRPSATPVFAGFGQPPQPANTTGGAFGGKSPFGQGTNNAFGNTGGIFGNKTAATPGGNVFGGMNNQSSTSTPATTNVFGGPTAGAATTNVFGSRPTTPAFNFGGTATTIAAPAVAAAAPSGFGAIGNKPPSFNFTGSKESTPDPASVFGQQNRSGTSTPFSSGGVGAGAPGVAGNVFGQPGQQPGIFGGASNNNSFTFGGAPSAPAASGVPGVPGGMNMPVVTPAPNPRRILHPRSRRR